MQVNGRMLHFLLDYSSQVLDEFIVQSNYTVIYVNDTEGLQAANDEFETRISYWALAFGGFAVGTFIVGYLQVCGTAPWNKWWLLGLRSWYGLFYDSI